MKSEEKKKGGNRDGDLTPDVRSETRAPSRRPQQGQGAMGTEGSQEMKGVAVVIREPRWR